MGHFCLLVDVFLMLHLNTIFFKYWDLFYYYYYFFLLLIWFQNVIVLILYIFVYLQVEKEDTPPSESCSQGPEGKHSPKLEEEIGLICLYCGKVLLEINYIVPSFVRQAIPSYLCSFRLILLVVTFRKFSCPWNELSTWGLIILFGIDSSTVWAG